MSKTNVVFDIGGVLVDWQPHLAFMEDLGSEDAAHAFLERTDFFGRNLRGDGGENFTDMAQELDDPADAALFAQYVTRYRMTVPNKVPGTWELLFAMKAKGTPIHAITNWSAETWPHGVAAHPELGQVFGTTIVSGQEGIVKPDPRIFACLTERASVAPETCLFIDDSEKNVAGARACGWDAVHFTDAAALEVALQERGLL